MPLLQFIKNKTALFKESLDYDPNKFNMRPYKVWFSILSVFIIVNLAVVFLSFYLFSRIIRNDIFIVANGQEERIDTFSMGELKETLNYLEGRDVDFKYLETHKPAIADPSK